MTCPKPIAVLVFATFSAATLATAEAARYRIELSNGTQVESVDRPVQRGTIVTFRPHRGAPLTGVPSEMIIRIVSVAGDSSAGTTAPARRLGGGPLENRSNGDTRTDLQPGEILVLGPTGDGLPQPVAAGDAARAANPPGTPMGAPGGGLNPNAVNTNVVIDPNNTIIGTDGLPRVASSTDLQRAQAAQTTVGPNGFPATATTAPTVIGPNGMPVLAPGIPGSSTPAIGPNGTPIVSSGAPPTVIGPNGNPVLAQPGQTGAGQPVIGPNGTPVLAPAGQPGAAAPVIGPNGTPVLAPSGQPGSAPPNTAPNGTPSSAPPAGAAPSGGASPGGRS